MSNWKQKKLGVIAPFVRSKVDLADLQMHQYISTDNMLNDKAGVECAEKLPKVKRVTSFRKGDVLFSNIRTYFKKVWQADLDGGASNDVLVFRTEDESILDHDFLYYYISSDEFINFTVKTAKGVKMPRGDKDAIAEKVVKLPSPGEQKSIVAVLSSLDAKIELLREQNNTLEDMAQLLFRRWFVDFNFPDENGKPYKDSGGKMIDSELGPIPDGWEVGSLDQECEITMGQSPKGESYNSEERLEIFFQGRTDFGQRFPNARLYTDDPKRFAEKFDVLVSVRAPVGDINVASHRCCIGRGLAAISSSRSSYILYRIKSLGMVFESFESDGTIFGSINKSSFSGIKVAIPKNEYPDSFDAKVRCQDEKIYNNSVMIDVLQKNRDILLPKLISGKLRI